MNEQYVNSKDEFLGMGMQQTEEQRKQREDDKLRAEAQLEKQREASAKENVAADLQMRKEAEERMKEEILEVFLEANPNFNIVEARVFYRDLRERVAMERFVKAYFREQAKPSNYKV